MKILIDPVKYMYYIVWKYREGKDMIDRDELMVDGGKVYQKEYTGTISGGVDHYNWSCIATFHHLKGSESPECMADRFFNSISSR